MVAAREEFATSLQEAGAPARSAWWGLLRSPVGVLGLAIVATLVICAAFAPWIAPYDPLRMAAGPRLAPPSWAHPFGTVDVLFSFTEIVIALACLAIIGTGLTNAMIAIGIATIPFYARISHSVVLVEKNKPYFESALAAGAAPPRLLFVHLLPNVIPTMIVVGTLGVSTAVLAAAGLSFLGLGAQPPDPEWGFMLSASRDLISRAPWTMIFPGLAISITVLGFNLLGDGIREVLDPRQQGR
jgi:peptide/nickel transport system permease protein